MATRPWVTPQEVRDYSNRESVRNRSDTRLNMDIFRAEQFVIKYTKNFFSDPVKYPTIPVSVKMAVILLAELYATVAEELARDKGGAGAYKSETFDDYSYTLADSDFRIGELNLGPLLDEFIEASNGNVFMRMRKL